MDLVPKKRKPTLSTRVPSSKRSRKSESKASGSSDRGVIPISIPSEDERILLSIMAEMTGAKKAEIVRALLEPHTAFIKEMLKEVGYISEYGSLNATEDDVLAAYNPANCSDDVKLEIYNRLMEGEKKNPQLCFSSFYRSDRVFR